MRGTFKQFIKYCIIQKSQQCIVSLCLFNIVNVTALQIEANKTNPLEVVRQTCHFSGMKVKPCINSHNCDLINDFSQC